MQNDLYDKGACQLYLWPIDVLPLQTGSSCGGLYNDRENLRLGAILART